MLEDQTAGNPGRTVLLTELTRIYLRESPQWLAAIEDGIRNQDAAQLRISAHTLKGALQALAASTTADAEKELEMMRPRRRFSNAGPALEILKHEMSRMTPLLTAHAARDKS